MSARKSREDHRLGIDSRSETGGNVLLRLEKETERQPERSESDEDDNSEGTTRDEVRQYASFFIILTRSNGFRLLSENPFQDTCNDKT